MMPEHLVKPLPDAPAWEVVDGSGRVVYRGHDLGLADEIYLASPGAHLLEVPGPAGAGEVSR